MFPACVGGVSGTLQDPGLYYSQEESLRSEEVGEGAGVHVVKWPRKCPLPPTPPAGGCPLSGWGLWNVVDLLGAAPGTAAQCTGKGLSQIRRAAQGSRLRSWSGGWRWPLDLSALHPQLLFVQRVL